MQNEVFPDQDDVHVFPKWSHKMLLNPNKSVKRFLSGVILFGITRWLTWVKNVCIFVSLVWHLWLICEEEAIMILFELVWDPHWKTIDWDIFQPQWITSLWEQITFYSVSLTAKVPVLPGYGITCKNEFKKYTAVYSCNDKLFFIICKFVSNSINLLPMCQSL